jgi:hypothetical protein
MNRLFVLFLYILSTFLTSCTSNEIGTAKDVNPEAIYFDYKIWGEEGNNDVTIKLQYRVGGKNGTTLLLEEPAKVELDGELLKADSSTYSGVYYEVQKPVASFTGRHTIVFTDVNKKQYKEVFNFQPVALETKIPDTLQRSKIAFKFSGIDSPDYLRVLMTDTSYTGEGINQLDTVYKDGLITIGMEDIKELVNGPIHLEITKENDSPVKNGTREGGRISISYGLKREFNIKN